MKTWLTTDQVAQLTGWTARHIRRMKPKLEWREVDGRSQYALESLPAEAQVRYAKDFALVPLAAAPAPKAIVSEKLEAKARKRFEPVHKLKRWVDGEKLDLKFDDGRPVRSSDDYAKWLAPRYGVTSRGLWKRYTRYFKGGGLVALSGTRSDRGQSRAFKKHPEAAKFVLSLYTRNLNITNIYDELKIWWRGNVNHGSQPPSESTLRAFLATQMPAVARDAAVLPKGQFDQKHAPYVRRDYEIGLLPNDVWVSDHRIHDVFFFNDCFTTKPKLAWMRIWETAIEDMRTRAIVGSAFSASPSSRTIASALRAAISRYGVPKEFYVDNGKDYRKIGKGALHANEAPLGLDDAGRVPMDPRGEGLLQRLGIKVRYCEPRHPQSKLIESYFSIQSKRLDKYFGGAYAGQRPDRRPDSCAVALKQHKLFLEGKLERTPLPPASHGIQIGFYWNEWFNYEREHSGHGMRRRTPMDVFNQLLPEDKRVKVDVRELKELFWNDREQRIVRNATVQLLTGIFEGADQEAQARLYQLNGQTITVAVDPDDVSEAVAYGADGVLFRLVSQQLVAQGLNRSMEEVKKIQQFRRGMRRNVMSAIRSIQAGTPTPLQLISGRAGITAATQPRPEDVEIVRALPLAAAVGGATVRSAAGPEEVAERNLGWLIQEEQG